VDISQKTDKDTSDAKLTNHDTTIPTWVLQERAEVGWDKVGDDRSGWQLATLVLCVDDSCPTSNFEQT